MNVVIACLNSKYVHASPAPWYLLGGIKKYAEYKHNVTVCEATINENIIDVKNRILGNNPDVIGLCCYIWNITEVYALISLLKAESNAKIVLGGPEVSFNAKEVLNNKNVDFVVSGEGEFPFAKLCDALQCDGSFDIDGVNYRKGDLVVLGETYIGNSSIPDIDIDAYANSLNGRIAYIETNRGCPYSCAFCLSGRMGGVCNFDLNVCFENILKLSLSGAKIIKFVDRTFNADKKRSKEIIRFIIDNYGTKIPIGTAFHFEIAGDILDAETIELFNTAPKGIFNLEIGMQSFNEDTLKYINRKTNTSVLINNIKALTSVKNVHTHIDLIAGLPLEGLTSFENSFNIGFSLNADMLQLGFLKLLHGANMREDTKKYPCEFNIKPPYEVISTPWLEKQEVSVIKACETSLERLCNSARFKRTSRYLFEQLSFNPFITLTNFGIFTGTKSVPLYEYVNMIYLYFLPVCDSNVLRDNLLCDIFEYTNMEKIPSILFVEDNKLHEFKKYLEQSEEYKKEKGIMRKIFLLYGENCGAFVDYYKDKPNKIIKIPFSEF